MDVVPLRPDQHAPPLKFAGLDAIRGLAALGVVLLHACVPYLRYPMPGLAWPVRDSVSSAVGYLFWGIEIFIMPLFLVMAGIFAWRTLDRRGPRPVIVSRAKRLLIPLLFGVLVVLPLDLYAWILGWVTEGLVAPVKLKSMKFDAELSRDLWGLSHLWFLQYLFLYVCCLAGAAWCVSQRPSLKRLIPSTPVAAVGLFCVAAITLVVSPQVVWGFQHSFLPVPSKWLYSGTFFAGGVLLANRDPNLILLRRSLWRLAIPMILLLAFSIAMGRWHLAGSSSAAANVFLAVMTTGAAWATTLWIIAAATRYVRAVPVSIQYLAAASFWVYVVHHPFLGLIHTDLKWLLPATAPAAKTLIAFGLCVGFSLLMYEGLVRKSALGRLLGFAWALPQSSGDAGRQIIAIEPVREQPAATRRAA